MLSGSRARLGEYGFVDAEIAALFDDRATVRAMLDFEIALARAEAACGVIPERAVAPLAAIAAEAFDLAALARGSVAAGNYAIPFVRALTEFVGRADADAAGYVHWGATSQDVIDTALVLQLRAALARCDAMLGEIIVALATLAREHETTLCVARTWLQHALPTTFGLRAAGWLSATLRARTRLRDAAERVRTLQFGGAAGTLAALETHGVAVANALARELDLTLPDVPWHAHRDRFVDVAAALGIVAGTLGKIARDVSLSMQSDVAELFEPGAPGRGGSSTLPQKRNPIGCAAALAVATRAPHLVATLFSAMPHEFERGLGGWQSEWSVLPELTALVGGALGAMRETLAGLEVDARRMRANLDESGGLALAEAVQMELARNLGRARAHELVEAAAKRSLEKAVPFAESLRHEPIIAQTLPEEAVRALLAPERYLGAAREFVVRALSEVRS